MCQGNLAFKLYRALTKKTFTYLSEAIISSKILQNQIFENVKTQQDASCKTGFISKIRSAGVFCC